MEKPTIFFSHSSKDKDYLLFIKNAILNKTSNTVEIFSSSDGESIPFGNNWIHKIESNLNNSKLMFVFVSPNSLKSNWIYFESGFSYSKGIKVIPVGINGIDIGILAPPINLLQGFNITSFEGLNNILTIINREFSTSFLLNFNDNDYNTLISKSNNVISTNHFLNHIDHIETRFSNNLRDNKLKPNAFEDILELLQTNQIKHSKDNNGNINLNGMLISIIKENIIFKIDQVKLEENIKFINQLFPIVYAQTTEKYWIYILFNDNIDILTTSFKISSRLSSIGIEMYEKYAQLYEYKNLLFALDNSFYESDVKRDRKILRIVYDINSLNLNEIYELIHLLFDLKIIWVSDKI